MFLAGMCSRLPPTLVEIFTMLEGGGVGSNLLYIVIQTLQHVNNRKYA